MKTAAAAERLGVEPSTLRYWRMIHYGPAYAQLSTRTFVYDEDDLIEWVAERQVVPPVRAPLRR
jgi:DNA-binding transcriptional MerR regulator